MLPVHAIGRDFDQRGRCRHAEDPLDANDVADRNPEVVERLKAELERWHELVAQGKLPEGDSTENMPAEELKRLRSLGYIR